MIYIYLLHLLYELWHLNESHIVNGFWHLMNFSIISICLTSVRWPLCIIAVKTLPNIGWGRGMLRNARRKNHWNTLKIRKFQLNSISHFCTIGLPLFSIERLITQPNKCFAIPSNRRYFQISLSLCWHEWL